MKKLLATTIPTTLWALALASPAAAQPPEGRLLPPPFATLIDSADANKDGALTRAELAAIDVFAKLDTNQDGKIDGTDFDRVFVMHGAPHGAFLLRVADEDQDGKLTRADWQDWISKTDADRDGLLQHDELKASLPAPPAPPEAPEPPDAPPAQPGFGRPPLPPQAPQAPLPPEPPKLNASELAATFDRFDTNHDGLLEGAELPPSRFFWRQRLPAPTDTTGTQKSTGKAGG